jgi:hypothetical protein
MSQKPPKPHVVKVYGYKDVTDTDGLTRQLVKMGHFEFPSKCAAEKFASEQRKKPEVSSAVLVPQEA